MYSSFESGSGTRRGGTVGRGATVRHSTVGRYLLGVGLGVALMGLGGSASCWADPPPFRPLGKGTVIDKLPNFNKPPKVIANAFAPATFYAWGYNNNGQLNSGDKIDAAAPVEVQMTGALQGKKLRQIAGGSYHTLALCTDGTLVAWGNNNNFGPLGIGQYKSTPVPALVDTSGALKGKKVVQIAASLMTSAALCSDGTVVTWGENSFGQLGNGTKGDKAHGFVPVAVLTTGALKGKKVTLLDLEEQTMIAVCEDGTIATWGFGANTTVPLAVDRSGVLKGKTVVQVVGSGLLDQLLLCSDGTLVNWGGTPEKTPVIVPASVAGPLKGKKIVQVAGGNEHVLVLCSDGTLATWGRAAKGVLGNPDVKDGTGVPVLVDTSGVLKDKKVVQITSNALVCEALCEDGTVVTWGDNRAGQLGNSSISTYSVKPVLVDTSGALQGKRVVQLMPGNCLGSSFFVAAK